MTIPLRTAPFSSGDLPGLALWLRADTGITLNGSRVSSWADQSGHATVTQATGAQQPLFVASGQNGRPVIRGDVARRLDVSGMSVPTSATYVFVVAKSSLALTYIVSGTNANFGLINNFGSNPGPLEWFNAADEYTLSATPGAGLHIYTVTQVNGGALIGYVDGVQVFSHTATVALQAIGAIGNATAGTTDGTDGDIAEIITWSRVLLASELAQVTSSLKAEYAIA